MPRIERLLVGEFGHHAMLIPLAEFTNKIRAVGPFVTPVTRAFRKTLLKGRFGVAFRAVQVGPVGSSLLPITDCSNTVEGMKVLFFACVVAFVQSPSFEIASVKSAGPWVPGQKFMRGGPGSNEPGRVTFTRANLRDLIMRAYDVWIDQVAGPDWLADVNKHVYTITATMPPDTTPTQFRLMLQGLLADRFQLRLHHETQSRPGYELVVAKGGPKLKEWTSPNEPAPYERGRADESGFASLDPNSVDEVALVFSIEGGRGPVRISQRGTIARFCRSLAAYLNTSRDRSGGPQARIVDRTGLRGVYDYRFEFTGTMLPSGTASPLDPAALPVASDPGPTLFFAIEKQLGLKLVKAKDVSIDVLVIDRTEKVPSEN